MIWFAPRITIGVIQRNFDKATFILDCYGTERGKGAENGADATVFHCVALRPAPGAFCSGAARIGFDNPKRR